MQLMSQIDFEKAYTLRGLELNKLNERVALLEEEIHRLKELLRLQQERLFGKKSEKSSHLNVSTGAADDTEPNEQCHEPVVTQVSGHTRTIPTRGKRQLDTSGLPKYTVIHDLSEPERQCKCCHGALHVVGQEKSGQLEIIPVQYCVIEHIRLKYGCRSCETIVMAPKPLAPLPKAIAGPSLLTDVVLNKYQYSIFQS